MKKQAQSINNLPGHLATSPSCPIPKLVNLNTLLYSFWELFIWISFSEPWDSGTLTKKPSISQEIKYSTLKVDKNIFRSDKEGDTFFCFCHCFGKPLIVLEW